MWHLSDTTRVCVLTVSPDPWACSHSAWPRRSCLRSCKIDRKTQPVRSHNNHLLNLIILNIHNNRVKHINISTGQMQLCNTFLSSGWNYRDHFQKLTIQTNLLSHTGTSVRAKERWRTTDPERPPGGFFCYSQWDESESPAAVCSVRPEEPRQWSCCSNASTGGEVCVCVCVDIDVYGRGRECRPTVASDSQSAYRNEC